MYKAYITDLLLHSNTFKKVYSCLLKSKHTLLRKTPTTVIDQNKTNQQISCLCLTDTFYFQLNQCLKGNIFVHVYLKEVLEGN